MTAGGEPLALAFQTRLPAPPGRVFAALTEARHLERWFCDQAASDPAPGGALTLRWTRPGSSTEPYEGRWLTFDPPRACSFGGGHGGYPGGDAGRVEFVLQAVPGGTQLTTRHSFPGPAHAIVATRYGEAWPRALARLEAYLRPAV